MKAIILALIISFVTLQAEMAVVVSKESSLSQLKKDDVRRIFLAKTKSIDSKRIRVLEIKNAEYKSKFYKKATGKSSSQLRSYWTILIFTGRARPPKQMKDMKELTEQLLADSKAISYIPLNAVTDEMKVLYTMKD